MKSYLNENERLDDLQCKGLKIIQQKDGFCFGIDAILLSNFVQVRPSARVIDFGTGTGIIPILLAAKTQAAEIVGIEIQADVAEMAQRSVLLNALDDKVKIVCEDIKDAVARFGKASFDIVVCNPPYMGLKGGIVNPNDSRAIARHEILCTLEDIVKSAVDVLVPGGKMAVVHRPHRLVDLICLMRGNGIEPKKMRLVYPSPNNNPSMVLIEAVKGEKSNLIALPPLYIHDGNGEYTQEIKDIYAFTGEK